MNLMALFFIAVWIVGGIGLRGDFGKRANISNKGTGARARVREVLPQS